MCENSSPTKRRSPELQTHRHLRRTPCRVLVTTGLILGIACLAALGAAPRHADAEEPPQTKDARAQDPAVLLRKAARSGEALSMRLALVEQVLEIDGPIPAGPAVRTGTQLLREPGAEESAAWLIHRGLQSGYVERVDLAAVQKRAKALLAADGVDAAKRALLHAVLFRSGERPDSAAAALTAAWPPSPFVLAAIRADLDGVSLAGGASLDGASDVTAVRGLIAEQLPALRALDQAAVDDPAVSTKGLDTLKSMGGAALPLLIAEVRRAATKLHPGREGRATRAALVLGHLDDRRATPALIAALKSGHGWLRTYAATALGDLGDPAGIVALARQCTILGDPLRARDQWEFPGVDNSSVAPGDWQSAEYYVTDTASADALLRLGVRGAAGWLIHTQLDPRKKNYRIRVFQDATDALRRSVPGCPVALYNVDAGLPLREAAWKQLVTWWHAHRHDKRMLTHELDDSDPRFQSAARELVDVFAGPSVREMMMAKAAIRLLGPLMTKALTDAIPGNTNAFHRAEIAESLGLVDDPRAAKGLLMLVRDRQAFVRKKAVKSLGAYVDATPEAQGLLIRFLSSKRAGSRVAAMEGLVHAKPSDEMRTAITEWIKANEERVKAGGPTWRTQDLETALTVVRMVQEGDQHLPAIRAGLLEEQRARRRIWWDLVRAALDLPEPWHDPVADPESKTARHISEQTLREALAKRRGS